MRRITLGEWRSLQESPTTVIYIEKPSRIEVATWETAKCGHPSLPSYSLLIDGKLVGVPEAVAGLTCPSCQCRYIEWLFCEGIKTAVPCARCGKPIWKCFPVGVEMRDVFPEQPWPYVCIDMTHFRVICPDCTKSDGSSSIGWWDGERVNTIHSHANSDHVNMIMDRFVA